MCKGDVKNINVCQCSFSSPSSNGGRKEGADLLEQLQPFPAHAHLLVKVKEETEQCDCTAA